MVVVLVPVEVVVVLVVVLVVDVPEASVGVPHLVKSNMLLGKEIWASTNCWLMQES